MEDVLLADLPEPVRGAEHEATRVIEDAGRDHLCDGVDEAGAAEAERLNVADHGQLHLAVDDLHAFDRALGGAHAAADLRRLERRPGGRGARERRSDEPSTISEFVPTSMKSRRRLSSVRPVASTPATMSGPT